MTIGVVLALAAGLFTASASIAQRAAAAPAPGELQLSWRLVPFLLHRPVWFVGILCMVAGFGFQLSALHYADLSLVEPVTSSEILFVFTYLALRARGLVSVRDWGSAAGMAAGLGGFLALAAPHGGSSFRPGPEAWAIAASCILVAATATAGLSGVRLRGRPSTPARRAALLAVSAGLGWGFVAAVIKELSAHVGEGPAAVFSNWSPYVLVATGAVAMFLASNSFHAGPLAATQPALTIVQPVVACILGVTLFGERIRSAPAYLAGEAATALVLVVSVVLLTGSPLMAVDLESAVPRRRRPESAGNEGAPTGPPRPSVVEPPR